LHVKNPLYLCFVDAQSVDISLGEVEQLSEYDGGAEVQAVLFFFEN
jgi:hypothetical protein